MIGYLNLSQWAWKKNDSIIQGIGGTFFFLFSLVIWSAIWASITRFTKRRHRFLEHLIFSLQWAVMVFVISFVLKYIFFLVCSHDIDYFVSIVFLGVSSSVILNYHLLIGTNLAFMKRCIISSIITGSLLLLFIMSYYVAHSEFNPNPHHYINIVPLPKKIIPAIAIKDEVKRLDSIF